MDASPSPSLELVRSLTDERVLRALMRHRRLTRAELAAETGISKPTAGESVRRLEERGLVADTGERTPGGRGRGRVGSYYALSAAAGTALAVSIGPAGITGELVDAYGETVARTERPLGRPASPAEVAAALASVAATLPSAVSSAAAASVVPGVASTAAAVSSAAAASVVPAAAPAGGAFAERRPRLAVVSAADPVDRATGRLVHLPDSPFLVGELDPVAVLAPHVAGPVTVDNDVNWAARAEREHAGDDFAYLYLGEGLGCAIVGGGEVARGRGGLAGEIAHLLTIGPHGRAVPFIEVFGRMGVRRPDSTAIDPDALLAATAAPAPLAAANRRAVGLAVAGVVAAIVALADPGLVVVGGLWGPALLGAVRAAVAELPRTVPVEAAVLRREPALTGARRDALDRLRDALVAAA
ncbi:ROK family transcriptional regulator [Dactylosporangium sp. McL0621]|uniref:ROK family transcriptional regulator n=1 Tax=Dactylosporangium sp. McL0621 TaxID=3415678 RepID=UPI003CE6E1FE